MAEKPIMHDAIITRPLCLFMVSVSQVCNISHSGTLCPRPLASQLASPSTAPITPHD